MPHDIKKRLIEVGDIIRTKPYNHKPSRFYVGPVVEMNQEALQDCTGQFQFTPSREEGLVQDYFGADESLLILKRNGDLPEGEVQEKLEE